IILPLLEQNDVSSNDKKIRFIEIIKKISGNLESNNIQLHLETSLKPEEEYQLLKELNHDKVRICFDMGNSTSFGYSSQNAINTVRDFLGSVHIKDRTLNGPSVPLGQGSVKFLEVFTALKDIKFDGPYSFQVYRNKDSDNIVLLRESLMFINNIISQIYDGEFQKN
ncbi:MAG: sugar phosphate isomerase/epimerase family protein, partial [Ignavibacteria bacterium]